MSRESTSLPQRFEGKSLHREADFPRSEGGPVELFSFQLTPLKNMKFIYEFNFIREIQIKLLKIYNMSGLFITIVEVVKL